MRTPLERKKLNDDVPQINPFVWQESHSPGVLRTKLTECLNKFLHIRKSNRSGGALTFTATASYNAVVGG